MSEPVTKELERVVREESGRLTAALVPLLGDFDLAEEMVQDAIVSALERWPGDGVPDNPGAWLMTTARRRALDRLRRDVRFRQKAAELARETKIDGTPVTDDRLRLLFTCCHPALPRESQVALTLKTIAGLSTAEIARAFLVPEKTIAQRIVRAKKRIRDEALTYRVPDDHELPDRLGEVLSVLYLLFNEGYLATAHEGARVDLATEAEWLTALLDRLMPNEPEVMGLLALMRIHLARASTRFDADGDVVLLENQDRSRWDGAAISDAAALVERAMRIGPAGPFQIQAAIAALHASAPSLDATDWTQITTLYGALYELTPTPVVALNRAVALSYSVGVEAALRELPALEDELSSYLPFHTTRSELLRRAGRRTDALAGAERALALATNPSERRLLMRRIDELRESPAG